MYKLTFKPFYAMAYPFIFYAAMSGIYPFYFLGFNVIEVVKYSRKYLEAESASAFTRRIVAALDSSIVDAADLRRLTAVEEQYELDRQSHTKYVDSICELLETSPAFADATVDVATLVKKLVESNGQVSRKEAISFIEGLHTQVAVKRIGRSVETLTSANPKIASRLELVTKVDAVASFCLRDADYLDTKEAYAREYEGVTDASDEIGYSKLKLRLGSAEKVAVESVLRRVAGNEMVRKPNISLRRPKSARVINKIIKRLPKRVAAAIMVRIPKRIRVNLVIPGEKFRLKYTSDTPRELLGTARHHGESSVAELRLQALNRSGIPDFIDVYALAKSELENSASWGGAFARGKVRRTELPYQFEAEGTPWRAGIDQIVADIFKREIKAGSDIGEVDSGSRAGTSAAELGGADARTRESKAIETEAAELDTHRAKSAQGGADEAEVHSPIQAEVLAEIQTPPSQGVQVAEPVETQDKPQADVVQEVRSEQRDGAKHKPWVKPKTGQAFDNIWLNPEHTAISSTVELRREAVAQFKAEAERTYAQGPQDLHISEVRAKLREWLNNRMLEYSLLLELETLWAEFEAAYHGAPENESILTVVSEGCDSYVAKYIIPLEDEKKALAAEAHISFKAMLDFTLMVEQFIWSSRFHYAASLGCDAIDDMVRIVTDWADEQPEEQQYLARWFRWWAAGERTKRLNDETLSGLEAVTSIKDKMVEYFDSRWGKRVVEYGPDGMYIYSEDQSYIDRIRGKKHGVAGKLVDKRTMKQEYGITEDDLVYDVESDRKR